MSPFPQTGQPVGGVGDGGDGAGGSVGEVPLEPHDPVLGLPLHVHREALLHDPLLSMFTQLNGVGEAVGLAVVGAAVVGGLVGTGADVGCRFYK